jgi:16S rRNA (cytosine967-C5)-methyltransferase
LVNAVLRKTSVGTIDEDPTANLPSWLVDRWAPHQDWLTRIRTPARINVAGRPPSGVECTAAHIGERVMENLWTLPEGIGSITELEGFQEGAFWVMDPAAAHVADMVAEAIGGTGTVLDACAAPGGKSIRMAHHGLDVVAVDREEGRLKRMTENLDRLGIDIRLESHDWSFGPHKDLGVFDAVLVDAPCSTLGTVRRHPEILWRRQLGDLHAQSIIQRTVLRGAAQHVRKGGALIYAVCSPEPEEGQVVVDSMDGWHISDEWNSVPPSGDEDAFQVFVLSREST